MTRSDTLELLSSHASDFRRFGVRALSLFGSRARGDARPDSDADLLVEFEGPTTFADYMGLKAMLEDLLGCPVDLVTRRSLKPRLKEWVEREAVRVS